jgi:hypothetical protein
MLIRVAAAVNGRVPHLRSILVSTSSMRSPFSFNTSRCNVVVAIARRMSAVSLMQHCRKITRLSRQHRIAASREGVSGVWSVVKFAVRAAAWRITPTPPLVGLATLIGCTLALAIAAPAFTRDAPRVPGAAYAERKDTKAATSRGGARVESAQSALLRAAVTRLAPQRRGTTDIYAVGIAGWTSLDVFVSEIDGAFAAIARILPIQDHTLRLLNNGRTLKSAPLATRDNLVAAIHAVGQVMDKDEDVLLLVMSSHGSPQGFGLQLPGGKVQTVTPYELKVLLDSEGIKNRVVIVSACYSGIFVPPLANDDTMVLTAADAVSSSFGCAAQREWTYFGDAFFRHGLQSGADFAQAFDHARSLIRGWETLDHLPPSNPQAYFGPALVAKLDPLFRATVH